MKLIHYTNEEFELKPLKYYQEDLHWQEKPNGLWVSVEGDFDWKWWCKDNDFRLENLRISYEVILKEDAKILHLTTSEEISDLTNHYPYLKEEWNDPIGRRICRTYEIDWNKIKEKYQGIVIAPYQWECRLNINCDWYYGWDCASGCIWDIDCIKEFKLIKNKDT